MLLTSEFHKISTLLEIQENLNVLIPKQEKHTSILLLSAEWNFLSGLGSSSMTLQVFFFQVNLFCSVFSSIQYHIYSEAQIFFPSCYSFF